MEKRFKIEDEKKVMIEMINRLPDEEVMRVKNFVFEVWRKLHPIGSLQKTEDKEYNNQEKRRLETPNKKQNSLDNLNDGFEGFRKEDEDNLIKNHSQQPEVIACQGEGESAELSSGYLESGTSKEYPSADNNVIGIVDNLNNERVATLVKTHKHKWKKMCRDEERNRDIYQCQLCTRIKCVDLKTGDKFILQEKYEI